MSGLVGAGGGGNYGGSIQSNMKPFLYQPVAQGVADQQFQSFINNYQNPWSGQGGVQPQFQNLLTQQLNDPNAAGYQNAASIAGATAGNVANYDLAAGNQLFSAGAQGFGNIGQLQSQVMGNPWANPMVLGAFQGGQALQGVGQQSLANAVSLPGLVNNSLYGLTGTATNNANYLNNLGVSYGNNLNAAAANNTSYLNNLGVNYGNNLNSIAASNAANLQQAGQLDTSALYGINNGIINAAQGSQGLGQLASSVSSGLLPQAQNGYQNLLGLASQTTQGLMPYAQTGANMLPSLAQSTSSSLLPTAETQSGTLMGAGNQILSTAFDPQNALYAQQYQQNQDATRAALAARGIDDTATGAGLDVLSSQNFNNQWLNQQLGRQATGLSSYQGAAGQALGGLGQASAQTYGQQSSAQQQGLNELLSASTGTFSPFSTAYGQGTLATQNAANLAYQLPAQANAQQFGQSLSAGQLASANNIAANNITNTTANNIFNQANQAANTGFGIANQAATTGFGQQLGAANAGFGMANEAAATGFGQQLGAANAYTQGIQNAMLNSQQLGAAGANSLIQGSAAPYNAYTTTLNNQIGQLGQLGNAGNSYGGLFSAGQGLSQAGIQNQNLSGLLPYQAGQNIFNNRQSALNNYFSAGLQGQNANQQEIGNLLQYMGLGQNAGQLALQGAAQGQQANSNTLGNIGSLAGLAMLAFSDRRLKKDVEYLFTTPGGNRFYRFRYLWDEPAIGVMADEIERIAPDAVITLATGHKLVDYAMVA